MNETDYSPTSGRIWPIVTAVVVGFCIAGAGLIFPEWLMPALVTGGAIMALGAMGGLTMLRLAQSAYHRVLAEQQDNRQKYESLVGNLPGAVYRGDWNADWTMNFMSEGIRSINGQVLRENTMMLDMCRELGFRIASDPQEPSSVIVTLQLKA